MLRRHLAADVAHLREFVRTPRRRRGVPRAAHHGHRHDAACWSPATGEWTRRRIGDPDRAAAFAKKNAIPLYDVAKVGYPQRMRDWNAARKADGAA